MLGAGKTPHREEAVAQFGSEIVPSTYVPVRIFLQYKPFRLINLIGKFLKVNYPLCFFVSVGVLSNNVPVIFQVHKFYILQY